MQTVTLKSFCNTYVHNDDASFLKSVNKLLDAKLPKEEFVEKLRREVCYYYWCKRYLSLQVR